MTTITTKTKIIKNSKYSDINNKINSKNNMKTNYTE